MIELARQMLPAAEAIRSGRAIDAVVPMQYVARETESRESLAELTGAFGDRVTPPVRRSTVVPQAFRHGLPTSAYRRSAPVAQDFQAACAAITSR